MPAQRTTGRRVTRGTIAALALGLYAVLLATGPLGHHDLACHLKSRTHCTACVYASVPGDDASVGRTTVPLPVVALLDPDVTERAPAGVCDRPAGRAPPA